MKSLRFERLSAAGSVGGWRLFTIPVRNWSMVYEQITVMSDEFYDTQIGISFSFFLFCGVGMGVQRRERFRGGVFIVLVD